MSDLISRQDAIDAIHEDADWLAAQGSDWQVERMERDKSILMSLPSAEKVQLSGEDATFDCISRQDAIDALNACCVKYDISPNYDDKRTDKEKFYDWWDMHKVLSMRTINDLPSASPDLSTFSDRLWKIAYERGKAEGRKKGKWIGKEKYMNSPEYFSWQCSVCGCVLEDSTLDKPYPFCPNCGSYNGGEEE